MMSQVHRHQTESMRSTTHLVLTATPAVGAALSAIVAAYAFIAKPGWLDGQTFVLFLTPIVFAVLSFTLLMRPDRDPPVRDTGVESFSGHMGPAPGGNRMGGQTPDLKGEELRAYEAERLWHQNLQSRLGQLIWFCHLVFALSFVAIFAFGL